MSLTLKKVAVILVIVMILVADCDAKRKKSKKFLSKSQAKRASASETKIAKQLELRETSPPNFVRLVIMRLIYGIAAQMNLEERVAGWFNGAFAPPNADYDDFGFGGDDLGDLGAGELFE